MRFHLGTHYSISHSVTGGGVVLLILWILTQEYSYAQNIFVITFERSFTITFYIADILSFVCLSFVFVFLLLYFCVIVNFFVHMDR